MVKLQVRTVCHLQIGCVPEPHVLKLSMLASEKQWTGGWGLRVITQESIELTMQLTVVPEHYRIQATFKVWFQQKSFCLPIWDAIFTKRSLSIGLEVLSSVPPQWAEPTFLGASFFGATTVAEAECLGSSVSINGREEESLKLLVFKWVPKCP